MNLADIIKSVTPHNKWLRLVLLIPSLLLILLAADMLWVRMWRRIPIGYDTTRLTGPLRPDGTVNYAAALDAVYSKGVTLENNAVPLLIEASGELSTDRSALFQAYRRKLFARLRMAVTVKQSGFHSYFQWVNLKLGNDLTNAQWDTDVTRVDPSFRLHPWTASQNPLAARWVHSNAAALAIFYRAVKRHEFYLPIISFREVNAPNAFLQNFHAIGVAAAARAMFRLGNHDTIGAIADINADMRLAMLMSKDPSLLARLNDYPVISAALRAEAAAAGSGLLSQNELRNLLRHTLPRSAILPLTAQLQFQRFDSLAFLEKAGKYGIRTLVSEFNANNPNGLPKPPPLTARLLDALVPVNFAATMRQRNRLYDRAKLAIGYRHYLRRKAALAALARSVVEKASEHPIRQWMNPFAAALPATANSLSLFFNRFPERLITRRRITILAVGLAIYKREHGHYPQRLSALVPKYVPRIPPDGFTGKALKYHLLNQGHAFVLYSVGPNGVDNGGKGSAAGSGNDDISVRSGVPE